MKRFSKIALIAAAAVSTVTFQSCTDLEEVTFEDVTSESFFSDEGTYYSVLVNAYGNLRPWLWNYYNISQVTSDETIVPTRGGDWGDGGVWRELHQHNWSPSNGHIVGLWNDANKGLAQTNKFVFDLQAADDALFTGDNKKIYLAEARVLRAYYYFQLMDFFGGVPILETDLIDPSDPANLPSRKSRAEVFDFIKSELKAAIPDLEATHPADQYGRITSGAANALLARLLLNAEVYSGTADYAGAKAACDAVINSGNYSLETNYHDNFSVDNSGSTEAVFAIPNLAVGGFGLTIHMRTMHYNQLPSSPWNGFCTLADFYNTFDTADVRSDIFLVGQQYDDAGNALEDRQGNPLDFTASLPGITGASETDGIRVVKWAIDNGAAGGEAGNDLAVVRYADVLLMKAECLLAEGDEAGALEIVNEIRARAGAADRTTLSMDELLEERGFELAWEGVRRMDLIRHGKFTAPWELKEVTGEDYVKLMPIPFSALGSNPNLTQNDGYPSE